MRQLILVLAALTASLLGASARAEPLTARDLFDLEYAAHPRVSPDGTSVLYERRTGDIMTDRYRGELWVVSADGADHRPLVQSGAVSSPEWSPSGDRVLFSSSKDGANELRVLWMDTRAVATVARLPRAAQSAAWSPDGSSIAFLMFVPSEAPKPAALPEKPEGAQWAEPARVIDRVIYRQDGAGYTESGATHLFTVPAEGGTPRRLTTGDRDHAGPLAWTPDGSAVLLSANLQDDWEHDPIESELYSVSVDTGELARLTTRDGPDANPAVSPDGSLVAYTGYDDRGSGYQDDRLWVLDLRTGRSRELSGDLDRGVYAPQWAPDGRAVLALYDDHGDTKLARFALDGSRSVLAEGLGGATLGRPYNAAEFHAGPRGVIAALVTTPERPADVTLFDGRHRRQLTALNDDLLSRRDLASAEEFTTPSSFDGTPIQSWIMRPHGFDASKAYPMILEIHGGPYANYGPRFSAECQLYAAAGYVVVYSNPRGSTSYGEAFTDLIHMNYPGQDYDDLISVVDAAVAMGGIDPDRLYVTGGSGGGVLSAWIVGKTDRFAAAVVAKPVINWISHSLTADFYPYFTQYWLPDYPWNCFEHAWARSPLSLVGNVVTPTMLLTGEEDHRTPIAESEQYYQALQLRKVPTRMVRIPGASHSIASRPSRLAAKVANILQWFEEHPG